LNSNRNENRRADVVSRDVCGPLDESIIKRAREAGRLDLKIHNLRDYAHDRHKRWMTALWRRTGHVVEARTDL